ncbi:MAG: hypothetical protein JWQ96_927 [Segetibacter sp.]|nr:hypothetical protein [Segetibacter sp.]
MTDKVDEHIKFKLLRCNDTFLEAKVLAASHSWNGVVNRLYYAAFYAVSALLLKNNCQVKTHSGQKSKFNEMFLKDGRLEREIGHVYNVLFNYREDGDYNDFAIYTKEETEPLIDRTEKLINEIKKLIN